MYQQHPEFEPPEDENCTIWRYLDFTKFVSLISTSSLWFARVDQLGDPFEGSMGRKNVAAIEHFSENVQKFNTKEYRKNIKQRNKTVFVSCWCMSEYENAAMWKLYVKSNEGIAIRTSFSCLKTAFDKDVYIRKVNYIDYNNDTMANWTELTRFFHKQKYFEHEKELRALIWKFPTTEEDKIDELPRGFFVPVNVSSLVKEIVVCPQSDEWFNSLVEDVVKKFNLSIPVKKSEIDAIPIF